MSNICYVILSDMHLGAENSILTNLSVKDSTETDNTTASAVLVNLIDCLRNIIGQNSTTTKPKLILNGDIIEFALASTNNAAMAFERFVELIMPAGGDFLFDNEVLYLSGNHDHNLWERARNNHYNDYLNTLKPGDYIIDELHCTTLFNPEQISATFLQSLFHRHEHLKNVVVNTVYPAHGILSDDKKKCVIISHGHYVESIYSLMTSVRSKLLPDRPDIQNFEELEEENYAWVDFFWSTLGRSGSVGKDINLIYDKLQDPEQVKILIRNLAGSLTNNNLDMIGRWMETKILQEILNITLGRLASSERNEPQVVLTPDAMDGLKKYIETYLMFQLKLELKEELPENISFIFGHTHKPFQQIIAYEGYQKAIKIYNSGGWVVDTMKPQALHGGSIILVDEHMDVVALQMYREGKLEVTLEELSGVNEEKCDFYARIKSLIKIEEAPWADFSSIVKKEISIRYENLASIAKSDN